MYDPIPVIEVRIWQKTVGAVALDPALRFYAFEYDPAFIRSGIELAPLMMPLAAAREPFVFTNLPEATYRRLPGLLADALPDSFGNLLIDAWMAREGVSASQITPLDRLAYMGRRGMGALEFRPARGPKPAKGTAGSALEMSALVESARRAIHGELDTDAHAEAALAQIIQVGTSAGGARAKAVVSWNARTNEIRAGQFKANAGFEPWLIKFDGVGTDERLGVSRDYGRIEYAYHLMARAAGVAMSDCRLLQENGRAHFMTRRFDRDGDRKHHLQTLCGLAHLDYQQRATHDVSQFFQAIEQLRLGYAALEEAFRRTVFNVLAANCDDHSKNISFLMREGGGWELAPAYDMTFAYNPKGAWTYQHLMSVNGQFADISRDDLLAAAERAGVGTAPRVLAQVADAVARWPTFAKEAGVTAAEVKRVRDHLRKVATAYRPPTRTVT